MSTTPPGGMPPPKKPETPSEGLKPPAIPATAKDKQYAYLLKSPFAKMFAKAGATVTGKEIHGIVVGILKNVMANMKLVDKGWQKANNEMKKACEGND